MAWAGRRWWLFAGVAVLLVAVLGWSQIEANEGRTVRESRHDGAPAPREIRSSGEQQTTEAGLTETRSPEQISWETDSAYDVATLVVDGDDIRLTRTFGTDEPLRLLAAELDDGAYTYELVLAEQPTERVRAPGGTDHNGRTHVFPDSIAQGGPLATKLSGSLSIVDGAILVAVEEESR